MQEYSYKNSFLLFPARHPLNTFTQINLFWGTMRVRLRGTIGTIFADLLPRECQSRERKSSLMQQKRSDALY
jgi:hypothetical protein